MIRRIEFRSRRALWLIAMGLALVLAGVVVRLWQAGAPGSVIGDYLAARDAYARGDSERATFLFTRALTRAPDDARLQAGSFAAHLWQGDHGAALTLAPAVTQHRKYGGYALLLLAAQALKQQNPAQAYEQAQALEALALAPDDDARLYGVILGLTIAIGENDTARINSYIADLEDTRVSPNLTKLVLGAAYQALGDIDKARAQYKTIVQSATPTFWMEQLSYAEFLRDYGDKDAKRLFLSQLQYRIGNPPVKAYIEAILDMPPMEPAWVADEKMARFLLAAADYSTITRNTRRILFAQLGRYFADTPLLRLQLGQYYRTAGQWQRAEQYFMRIPATEPYYAIAQITSALMLQAHGAGARALALLKPLATGSARKEILFAMADIHREQKNYDAAERIYDELLAHVPMEAPHWHTYFARGIVRAQLDKWALAEQDLLIAQRLSGGDPYVLNYLGYSWVDQGVHVRRALGMIQHAVRAQPYNGAFVDSLGWAHYRLGELTLALRYLEQAAELSPTDPVITDHLGDALWHKGRRQEARAQWQRVLKFKPEEDLRRAVEQKLRSDVAPDYRIENSRL